MESLGRAAKPVNDHITDIEDASAAEHGIADLEQTSADDPYDRP